MLLPLIAPGARGVNSLLLEGGKFWTHLRRPVLAGVTPRSDWTPGMSQGPSEDKVQLRAATLLIEQTGAGCVDTEGRGLNRGLLRMGGHWKSRGDCQESSLEAKRVGGVQVDHGEGTG